MKMNNKNTLEELQKELYAQKNPKKAKLLQRFFKTGFGEYAEGDIFYGIQVPDTRKTAKNYAHLSEEELSALIKSKIHEERQCALIIMVQKAKSKKTTLAERKKMFEFYLKHTQHINNWDLVDVSAPRIIGEYLHTAKNAGADETQTLYNLAKSADLWEKRIAIIATAYFISKKEYEHTLKISEILLNDTHDLMHKAVGWMLREVGKRDLETEEKFLRQHYKKMPRTMLRYAIEKFPETKRQGYLKGTI